MICAFSHNPAKPRRGDVYATVEVSHFVGGHNVPLVPAGGVSPVDARYAPVETVLRLPNIAKICYSIVQFVTVDMVNNLWLFAMNKKPRKPMGKVAFIFESNSEVSVTGNVSGGLPIFSSKAAR
jgi:hypothetical protein